VQVQALSADAAHLLLTYAWPGNVRELDNLLQRALILVNGPVIRQEHIQFELANEGGTADAHIAPKAVLATASLLDRAPAGMFAAGMNGAPAGVTSACAASPAAGSMVNSLANSLDQAERDLILDALRSGQGNRREAAERLGISQRTLRYKLARLREAGIDVPAA